MWHEAYSLALESKWKRNLSPSPTSGFHVGATCLLSVEMVGLPEQWPGALLHSILVLVSMELAGTFVALPMRMICKAVLLTKMSKLVINSWSTYKQYSHLDTSDRLIWGVVPLELENVLTHMSCAKQSLFPSTRSCKQSIFCTDWWKAKLRWSDVWEDMFGGEFQWLFISKIQRAMQWTGEPIWNCSTLPVFRGQSHLQFRTRQEMDWREVEAETLNPKDWEHIGNNLETLASGLITGRYDRRLALQRVSNFAIKIKVFMPSLVLALDAVVMPAVSTTAAPTDCCCLVWPLCISCSHPSGDEETDLVYS